MIEDTIRITVLEVRGSQVKLGIHAPISVRVNREEVLERQRAEAGLPPLDLPPAEGQTRDRANGQRPASRAEHPRSEPRDFSPARGGQRRSSSEPRSEERRPGDYPARGRELPGERDRDRGPGRGGRGTGGPGTFSRGSRPGTEPARESRRPPDERWEQPRWESTRREEPRRDGPRREEPRRDEPRREEPRRDEPRRQDPHPRSNDPRRAEESRDNPRRDPWAGRDPGRDPGRDDPNRDYGRRFKRPPAAEGRRPSSNPLLGQPEPPAADEPGTIRRYREPQAMQAFRPRRPPVGPTGESSADEHNAAANGGVPGNPDPARDASPPDESDSPPKAKGGSGDFEAA
jgi:hypothetical protein